VPLSAAGGSKTFVTPTDGSMASNTAQDGVLGSQYRVKYASAGTYTGATSLEVDVVSARFASLP